MIIYWILEDILLISFFLWQMKFLFSEPIKGGNGKTQMNELAQVTLIYTLVYIIRIESRTVGTMVDSSVVWAIVIAVAALAGIKEGTFKDIWGGKKKEEEKEEDKPEP